MNSVVLICPKEIGGKSVDDQLFRSRHKQEKGEDIGTSSTESLTVFERMLGANWERDLKCNDLESLRGFNVTYNVYMYCYKNTSISWV